MTEEKEKWTNKNEDLYKGKTILAPMVRVSTMPMRLLALDYGADLVYCEEIIDRKILLCHKQDNTLLGTTDFVLGDGTVVFRTCEREKERLIFQIGTCDAKRAVAAAKKIEPYVAGIDVNMGCPKEFSIKGGMGAALLTQPEKIKQILTSLVQELTIPVTCKIRVLPQLENTIELVKLIEKTGVSAIAVHGRTKAERSRDPCRSEYIRDITNVLSIPVIANGGSKIIKSRQDMLAFMEETNASSVMVARAAEWNCSVFRKDGPLYSIDVLKEYLRYAFQYDNNEMNTKYCVLQILHDKMTELPEAILSQTAKSLQDFANIWGMTKELDRILQERKKKQNSLVHELEERGVKRRKVNDNQYVIELPVKFEKRFYKSTVTPKSILNDWCKQNKVKPPSYRTIEREGDRYFHSTVCVEDNLFTNTCWEKSKQLAEQGAAISCLVVKGVHDGRISEPELENEELRKKWKEIVDGYSQVDNGNLKNGNV